MKPSLTDVLPLLNANCGDVLKAVLLSEFFPELPKINPLYLKAPTGEVEAAFAAFKAAQSAAGEADELLAAVKADHATIADKRDERFIDRTVQALIVANSTARPVGEMPTSIRFEDVTTGELTIAPKPTENALGALITVEEDLMAFPYSYVGLLNRLKALGIDGVRIPGKGLTKFYPRDRVVAACSVKGKHLA